MRGKNLSTWGAPAGLPLKLDCRQYCGDRPCGAGVQGVCPSGCAHYDPMGYRILLIKLGALGDVIRTAALLPGLKEAWPQSHITWVSRSGGVRALANHPDVDRLLPYDAESLCHLEYEHFDLCLNLDKEPGPAALAMRVRAREKRGVGLSVQGTAFPLNPACADYFELGLSDDLKFKHNRKTYPHLIYEALGLEYGGQRYRLYPGEADRAHAAQCWRSLGIGAEEAVVGLNTGAGNVFANKSWPPAKFAALARRLVAEPGWRVALLGGPHEREVNARLAATCPGVVDTGGDHAELQFAALVQRCNVVVTGDTMAMHVAIAGDVPCVVLFGPTCHQEIDLFGRGEKLVTGLSCAPCYRRQCDRAPNCMDDIGLDDALAAVRRWAVVGARAGRTPLPVAEVRA